MIPKIIDFLKRLEKHNDREWFEANKAEYQEHRKNWIVFVQAVIAEIAQFDADVRDLEASKCIFRINRDVRFSKDKSPYKTNFGASISKTGIKNNFCGYYLHISPSECFFAGGVYMPEPEKLASIRQEIDYRFEDFKKIIGTSGFKKTFGALEGEKLSRPPKGYDAANPAIEFIKQKHFLATHTLTESEIKDAKIIQKLGAWAKEMYPLNEFLFEAIR